MNCCRCRRRRRRSSSSSTTTTTSSSSSSSEPTALARSLMLAWAVSDVGSGGDGGKGATRSGAKLASCVPTLRAAVAAQRWITRQRRALFFLLFASSFFFFAVYASARARARSLARCHTHMNREYVHEASNCAHVCSQMGARARARSWWRVSRLCETRAAPFRRRPRRPRRRLRRLRQRRR